MPDNIDRRNIIRNSWMKYRPNRTVVTIFFIGSVKTRDIAVIHPKHFPSTAALISESHYELFLGFIEASARI